MGRAKLRMELIQKEKARHNAYQKRKAGLIKKAEQFTILCDVRACMIIFGPNSQTAETWPPNPEQVEHIIRIYKDQHGECGKRTSNLSDFFAERKKKAEEDLTKMRKRNMEAKYPTWFDFMDNFTEPELRLLALALETKSAMARTMVDLIRGKNENFQGLLPQGLESDRQIHGSIPYPTSVDQSQMAIQMNPGLPRSDHMLFDGTSFDNSHSMLSFVNPAPITTLDMSGGGFVTNYNGPSCSYLPYEPFKHELCFDPAYRISGCPSIFSNPDPNPAPCLSPSLIPDSDLISSMPSIFSNPDPNLAPSPSPSLILDSDLISSMHYDKPTLQVLPPLMQCDLMNVSSQAHAPQIDGYDDEYQMKQQQRRY